MEKELIGWIDAGMSDKEVLAMIDEIEAEEDALLFFLYSWLLMVHRIGCNYNHRPSHYPHH